MGILDLKCVNYLVRIAIEKARVDYGKPVCVAVCDASGFLLAFQRAHGRLCALLSLSRRERPTAPR